MSMTLDQLIEDLEDAREDLGGDAEIRIAFQPNWPIRTTLRYVTVPRTRDADDLYGEGERAAGQDEDGGFCWLAAGEGTPDGESPYAPRWAWQGGEASRS